ncbi:MAG: LacI family DNA-binding transcriptional regulator [Clostridia bacterium]|nr:LacI family DNA-binding transcriptional regulator [Clostridia bacterium]MBR2644249.1 LacI family DNA-binding transcriptional regulator [Clostridia bacterium]
MGVVTLKDVAKVAGVSYATVSRALSGSPEIGESTRKRVVRICEEMGYTPNSVARSMVMKRTNIIGLIVTSIDNPFMSEMTAHLEIYARKCGYNLMVCNSSYDLNLEKEVFSLLMGRKVDGIILIPVGNESYDSLKNLTAQVPTVFIGENMLDLPENYVSVDNTNGMQQATEYLYSLGHRSILYLGAREKSMTHQLRVDGYLNACKKLGIEPNVIRNSDPRSSFRVGYALAKAHFETPFSETAILCAADTLAIGVIQAAYEKGIRIPRDLSLMGFDNISFSALPPIDLTTVNQPKQELAVAALDMLINRIKKPEASHTKTILSPSLVIRNSCRAIGD